MTRPIKFRAWDGVDYISTPFTIQDVQTRKIEFTPDCPVMQFTGLTDRNGVDIYEGDVVRIHNYNTTWKNKEPQFDWRVFEVKYNHYTWAFTNDAIYIPLSDYSIYDGSPYTIEVIGNIYEHPELMEGGNPA